MSKINCITLLLCTLTLPALAQKNFKYKAALPKIDSTGFYRISLQPAFLAKANEFEDIRILDSRGRKIPYLKARPQILRKKSFVSFNTINLRQSSDTGTTFIVENRVGVSLEQLWIKLQNTTVQRKVDLLGSDDLKRWFAVQENIPLQQTVANNDGTYMQLISFPKSNYRYFKLLVDDRNKNPINFLEAGVYTVRVPLLINKPILPVKINRIDSNKTTFINIKFNDNYIINKIHLNITSPKYFKRSVTVYKTDKNQKQWVTATDLNSAIATDLLTDIKAEQLLLQINNDDNLPLEINGINVFQKDISLISYLNKNQNYQIFTGDSAMIAPAFDIDYFTDSIPAEIPQIEPGPITRNTAYQNKQAKPERDYTLFIWIAIIVAAGLLLFLTLKMTKEVGKKAGKDNA